MTPRLAIAGTTLMLLSGCANTITERISLAETCQRVLDNTASAPTWSVTRTILKARLGNTAACSGDANKLMLQCAYADMNRRFAFSSHKRYESINSRYLVLDVNSD